MPRYSLIAFGSLLLISGGGCNKATSNAASPREDKTANAAATSGVPAAASTSLARPSVGALPTTDQDAIRAAVHQHLARNSNLNMAAMDLSLTQTSISGDQAQADVEFRLKQGGTTMQMTYSLIRHASGWLVTNSRPGGGQFAHPPMNQNHSATASGAPPNPGTSAMPDVHDFFKNTPAVRAPRSANAQAPKSTVQNGP
jgi:hypothetical protein